MSVGFGRFGVVGCLLVAGVGCWGLRFLWFGIIWFLGDFGFCGGRGGVGFDDRLLVSGFWCGFGFCCANRF